VPLNPTVQTQQYPHRLIPRLRLALFCLGLLFWCGLRKPKFLFRPARNSVARPVCGHTLTPSIHIKHTTEWLRKNPHCRNSLYYIISRQITCKFYCPMKAHEQVQHPACIVKTKRLLIPPKARHTKSSSTSPSECRDNTEKSSHTTIYAISSVSVRRY